MDNWKEIISDLALNRNIVEKFKNVMAELEVDVWREQNQVERHNS